MQVRCMKQATQSWWLWDNPEGWGREGCGWGVQYWGTPVHPWLIHVNAWWKPTPYYKVISLQLKKNWKKKRTPETQSDLWMYGSSLTGAGGQGCGVGERRGDREPLVPECLCHHWASVQSCWTCWCEIRTVRRDASFHSWWTRNLSHSHLSDCHLID